MKLPLRPALPVLLVPLALCWAGIVLASELAYQGFGLAPALPFLVAGGSAVAAAWLLLHRQVRGRAPQCEQSLVPGQEAEQGREQGHEQAHAQGQEAEPTHTQRHRRLLSLPLLSLFTFCLALALGTLFYSHLAAQSEQGSAYNGALELIVVEDTRHYPNSSGSEALVQGAHGEQLRMRIFWNEQGLVLAKGSHISAECSFAPLREDQRWLFERGMVGTLSLSNIVDRGFSDDVWGAIDGFRERNVAHINSRGGEGAALLAGILLGWREGLQDSVVEQDFITCGLTHLIAVSGSHLAVVAALLSWFLKKLPLRRGFEIGVLLLVLVLYVMLTGLQPSAIRSALMAGVAGCSFFVGRRGHAPSALAVAALAMLLIYPANAYSLGFWLSVCAVMGISLFANLVAQWIATAGPLHAGQNSPGPSSAQAGSAVRPSPQHGAGAVSSALALTVTATGATLPIAVPTFGVLSLVGPLANLLAGPLIAAALVLGMLALVLLPLLEPLASLLLTLATFLCDATAWLAAALSQLPWASIPLALPLAGAAAVGLAVAALVYFRWPEPSAQRLRAGGAATLAALCLLAFLLPQLQAPRLVMMDVGQGDALLVQERGSAVLIDTGASDAALVHALARNGVTRLDAVVITHLDSDHAGALSRLRGLVDVKRIYFARGLAEYQAGDEYLRQATTLMGETEVAELAHGDLLRLGITLSLEMLWPEKTATEGSNAESICLLLRYDEDGDGSAEQQALLTGDAESAELAQILTSNPGLSADIIKLGHHGSSGAITGEQLASLSSTVGLISVGAHNRYGHPTAEILEILEAGGVRTLRTDQQGDISCIFKGRTLELYCASMVSDIQ
ncbi:MAG: DNA internalization-related competence protein ComEC/Rec2 [Coriobacteriales bacterium]|jgi:competence protein ComEC|nr:DNA internalization-related competence protein ComEC/Rec2 [Coriobacteriales bacterium]